ncbi:MAG: acylphosphatase [Candidatus Cloacimonetes bacterium]|nr:acylphosphatase [Candidatus Cloacimonadota bacterium]
MVKSYKILIEGRVQGVGYRYFAYHTALKSGLKGYVRNLNDGNVEVLAIGEEDVLSKYISELRKGPGFANVSELSFIELDATGNHEKFIIKY